MGLVGKKNTPFSLQAQCFFSLIHVLPLVFLFLFWVCFVPFSIDEALFWFLLYRAPSKIRALLNPIMLEKADQKESFFPLSSSVCLTFSLLYFSLCRLFWLNRCASFSFWGSSTKPEFQNNTLPSLIILWQLYLLASSSLTSRVRSWVNKCFCFNLPWIHCPLSVFVLISNIRCFPYLTMNRFKLALCSW